MTWTFTTGTDDQDMDMLSENSHNCVEWPSGMRARVISAIENVDRSGGGINLAYDCPVEETRCYVVVECDEETEMLIIRFTRESPHAVVYIGFDDLDEVLELLTPRPVILVPPGDAGTLPGLLFSARR